jgi:hypothetical protein
MTYRDSYNDSMQGNNTSIKPFSEACELNKHPIFKAWLSESNTHGPALQKDIEMPANNRLTVRVST